MRLVEPNEGPVPGAGGRRLADMVCFEVDGMSPLPESEEEGRRQGEEEASGWSRRRGGGRYGSDVYGKSKKEILAVSRRGTSGVCVDLFSILPVCGTRSTNESVGIYTSTALRPGTQTFR